MRKSKPFLRPSDGQYCGDLADGTRLPLGKNNRIAEKRWNAILRSNGVDLGSEASFHELLDAYEAWFKAERAASTYASRRFPLQSMREFMPQMRAGDLTPQLVSSWIASTKAKSPTTKSDRITQINSVMR